MAKTAALKRPKDKGVNDTAFAHVFAELRSRLQEVAPELILLKDEADCYHLEAGYSPVHKKTSCSHRRKFGRTHFMPIFHCGPLRQNELPPLLKKRMQGKACFNFKTIAPEEREVPAVLTWR